MSTQVSDLHNLFTDRTGDVLVSSDYVRWPKAQRYRIYTQAFRILVADGRLVRSTVAVTITAAGIQGNSGYVTFAGTSPAGAYLNKSDIFRVENAYWDGKELCHKRKDDLELIYPDSAWRTGTGTPLYWNMDAYGEGKILLAPIPDANSSASGFRVDYIPTIAAFTSDADYLPVADIWAYAGLYKALAIAYSNESDSELIAKGQMFEGEYRQELSKILSMSNIQEFGQDIHTVPYSMTL